MPAQVDIRVSQLLAQMTGGVRDFRAQGETIDAVLRDLGRREPGLGRHLFDDSGATRRNVLCLHGGAVVRPAMFATHEVADGDEIVLTNALAAG